jgi:hypothetical protein
LGAKDEDANLNAEVSSRLDELFGGEDPEEPPVAETSDAPAGKNREEMTAPREAARGKGKSGEATPIDNLKALVFSIDWEITDKTMKEFLQEVKRLKARYQDDRIYLLFLKLHESLGKYIKARKARAHPDAIKLVTSVYKKFEKALLSPQLSEAEKKKLISGEVKKYKSFKQRILSQEGTAAALEEGAEASQAAPSAATAPAPSGLSPEYRELADYILAEVKKTIQEEFRILRQLIKNMGA